MGKRKRNNNTPKIITVIINVLLFIAVLFLMNLVQGLLKSDSKITLTEVVTQNKDVITSKLNLEMNNVNNIAKSVALHIQGKDMSEDNLRLALKDVLDSRDENRVFAATKDGIAVSLHEENINVSGRKYFITSLEGNPNISDKLIARNDGSDIFMISVPMKINEEIVGTIQRTYSVQEMYDLCTLSLFSSKGTMDIINKDGYIMISSEADKYNTEKDNYYRLLYGAGNAEESTKLEKNIRKDKDGFMEVYVNGEDSFMTYTPIEGIHDWYLVTSVAKTAISPNGNIVIRMFYIILVFIVLVFGASMFYFIYFKSKQQARIKQIAFVDPITKGDSYTKFQVDFKEILEHCEKDTFYLLKFDIDNFKYINNYYSFDQGDKILF